MKIECSICFEQLTPPSNLPISSTKCGHLFHYNCINDWVVHNVGNCPQCRAHCAVTDLRNIFFNNHSDRRHSELFNSTIVKDMNEFQHQLLSEQDALIESKNKLDAEIQRLREQLAEKDHQNAVLVSQLNVKDEHIAALQAENTRTQFTNEVYKRTIQHSVYKFKTEKK